MTLVILPANPKPARRTVPDQHLQVVVNIHAQVLDPEIARRKANVWLLETVGNLLGAENSELILGDRFSGATTWSWGRPTWIDLVQVKYGVWGKSCWTP